MEPTEQQDPDAPYRVGALTDPRPQDPNLDTWPAAMHAAYERSQEAQPWDQQVLGLWDNRDCLRAICFEGTIFTP